MMESELLIPVMLTDLPGAVMKTCSCLEEQAALSCVFGWEFIPGETCVKTNVWSSRSEGFGAMCRKMYVFMHMVII